MENSSGEVMNLLPPYVAKLRSDVPVAYPLPIAARPGCEAKARPRDLSAVSNLWARTHVLTHTGTGPDESFMLIDKRHPHALHEVMLMSAGKINPGLHGHSAGFVAALAAAGTSFADYCGATGLYPVMSWSFDPATVDRESIQGEKRFHAHLSGRTPAELATVDALTRPLGELGFLRQRRVVDEATVLGAVLAYYRLPPLAYLEPVEPLSSPEATGSLLFRAPGGWRSLGGILADLAVIHDVLAGVYRDVLSAWTTGQPGRWQRPVRRAEAAWQPFTGPAGEALDQYMRGLSPLPEQQPWAMSRDLTTHLYPLAGLAYSTVISGHAGELRVHVRPVVFSDLGGAGVTVINGIITKVTKGVGVFTADQMRAREAFQRGYLSYLRSSEYGEAAFCPLLAEA